MPEEVQPPTGPKTRALRFERAAIDVSSRIVPLSVSSDDDTVLRYVYGAGKDGYGAYAWEVLAHDSMDNIDLSRFQGDTGGPLLFNHDRSVLIGRFIPTAVQGGKLRGNARFGRSAKADESFQDVQDDILIDCSIYYDYDPKDVEVTGFRDGFPIATIKKWALIETSMVPVPADVTVGVGRNADSSADADTEAGTAEDPDPDDDGDDDTVLVGDDAEDVSLRGGHQDDCENEDCTEDNPCDECIARCASSPDRAAQAPGDRAPVTDLASGQRNQPTPAVSAGTTRKADQMPLTPEEIAAAQAAGSTTQANDVAEALQIRAIAEQLGHGRKAEEILSSGLSMAEARAKILEHLHTNSGRATPKSLEELGASQAEVREFNYGRACLNAVSLAEGGRGGGNLEAEISATIEKAMPANYKRHGGIFLPYAVERAGAQRSAAMDTQTATQGAETIFTQPGQVIDVLRNALVVGQLGATVYTGLDAPLGLPRQDTDVVASWVTEDGGVDVPETEMATSLVTLTPKTLMATTATTRQLLELAVKNFEIQGRIMNSIAYASQKAIDYASMFGSGVSPIPQGVWGAAGVTAVPFGAATGVVPTAPYAYQDIIKMIAAVAAANIPFGRPGFVTTPQMAGVLMSTLKFAVNGASELWDGSILEGNMAGMKALSTNQVPSNLGSGTNCHGLIFGAWENLLIGIFGNGFEVIVDPYALKKRGIIEVTSFNMADVKLAHAAAFSTGTNACVSGTAQSAS